MSDFPLIFALLLGGYLLLLVEIFFVPGFTVPGIVGLISIGAGCYIVWTKHGAAVGGLTVIGSVVVTVFSIIALFKSPLGRRLKLEKSLGDDVTASRDYSFLLGKRGVADSTLRPAGIMLLDGERYNVVTEGEFIKKGSQIEVVEVEGNRIVVREAEAV